MYKSLSFFYSSAAIFSPPTSLSTISPRLRIIARCALSSTSDNYSSVTFIGFLDDDSSSSATSNLWCTSKALILSLHIWKSFEPVNFSTSSLVDAISKTKKPEIGSDTNLLKLNQSPRSTWYPQDPFYETRSWFGTNTKLSFNKNYVWYLKSITQSKKNISHTYTKDYSGSANFLPTSTVKRETSFTDFQRTSYQYEVYIQLNHAP